MSGFVVTVEFQINPRERDGFLRLVSENARLTAESEPGCRQFDVVVPKERNDRVYLYEIYDSQPDFELHTAQSHFIEFDRLTKEMVKGKKVTFGQLHFAGRSRRSRSRV
jgi:quinol monooxygenase YgiN